MGKLRPIDTATQAHVRFAPLKRKIGVCLTDTLDAIRNVWFRFISLEATRARPECSRRLTIKLRAHFLMSDTEFWSAYVRAYRKRNKLTQAALAAQLDVQQQSVSRWEQGKQLPDISSQKKLKAVLGLTPLMAEADWVFRVSHSHGEEALVRPDGSIIAFSPSVRAQWNLPDNFQSAKIDDFLPGMKHIRAAEYARFGLQNVFETGIFEGAVRHVYIALDFRALGRLHCKAYDLWPIVTAENKVLSHVVGYDIPWPDDADAVTHFRIRKLEMRKV